LCSDAIHAQTVQAGLTGTPEELALHKYDLRRMKSVAVVAGGATLVNTAEGVVTGDAQACGFRIEPQFFPEEVIALELHPTRPELAFALLAFEGATQGTWRRGADGVWSRFGAVEPTPGEGARRVLKSMALAKNDSDVRIYQTLWRYDPKTMQGSSALRVTDDGAQNWREYALASDPEELALLKVDPTQRDRVVAVIRRKDNMGQDWSKELDLVMLSSDGGASFRRYAEVAALADVAFAPDGTLWIADSGATLGEETRAGLFRAAPGLAEAPVQLSRDAHLCVTYSAAKDVLYGCQYLRMGTLDRQTGALTELVRFDTVSTLASCPGLDVVATCSEQLCDTGYCLMTHFPRAPACKVYNKAYCGPDSVGGGSDAGMTSPDASAPDAQVSTPRARDAQAAPDSETSEDDAPDEDEATDAGVEPKRKGGGCSCTLLPGPSPATGAAWLGLALSVWQLRRRSRASRR
jgi:hypothetical protein